MLTALDKRASLPAGTLAALPKKDALASWVESLPDDMAILGRLTSGPGIRLAGSRETQDNIYREAIYLGGLVR